MEGIYRYARLLLLFIALVQRLLCLPSVVIRVGTLFLSRTRQLLNPRFVIRKSCVRHLLPP